VDSAQPGLYFTDRPATLYPMLVQLENDRKIDIPAGVKDFIVTDEFTMPEDVELLAIYPHAHYLGRNLQAFATYRWNKEILDPHPRVESELAGRLSVRHAGGTAGEDSSFDAVFL